MLLKIVNHAGIVANICKSIITCLLMLISNDSLSEYSIDMVKDDPLMSSIC